MMASDILTESDVRTDHQITRHIRTTCRIGINLECLGVGRSRSATDRDIHGIVILEGSRNEQRTVSLDTDAGSNGLGGILKDEVLIREAVCSSSGFQLEGYSLVTGGIRIDIHDRVDQCSRDVSFISTLHKYQGIEER